MRDQSSVQPGHGALLLERVGEQAAFSTCLFRYPLKLTLPGCPSALTGYLGAAYMLSFGGGLVQGDAITLESEVRTGCTLLLLTQGSTKVFKPISSTTDPLAGGQRQRLTARVQSGATVLLMPAPVTCFARAAYSQQQIFNLADSTSSLVVLDWLTSGRKARGEHWSFTTYRSEIRIVIGEKLIVNDVLLLEDDYRPRVEPYSCYATLILVGPASLPARNHFADAFHAIQQPARRTVGLDDLLWSYSAINPDSGIVRVGAIATELVRDFLRHGLVSLEAVVGSELYRAAWA